MGAYNEYSAPDRKASRKIQSARWANPSFHVTCSHRVTLRCIHRVKLAFCRPITSAATSGHPNGETRAFPGPCTSLTFCCDCFLWPRHRQHVKNKSWCARPRRLQPEVMNWSPKLAEWARSLYTNGDWRVFETLYSGRRNAIAEEHEWREPLGENFPTSPGSRPSPFPRRSRRRRGVKELRSLASVRYLWRHNDS